MSDHDLMRKNLDSIANDKAFRLRISKEHYVWLCMWQSLVRAIVQTAGGSVEGHPTSTINILQRIRALKECEEKT